MPKATLLLYCWARLSCASHQSIFLNFKNFVRIWKSRFGSIWKIIIGSIIVFNFDYFNLCSHMTILDVVTDLPYSCLWNWFNLHNHSNLYKHVEKHKQACLHLPLHVLVRLFSLTLHNPSCTHNVIISGITYFILYCNQTVFGSPCNAIAHTHRYHFQYKYI